MELSMLQEYWWLLISVLGAILVFMLFVQGGQTFLLGVKDGSPASRIIIESMGHKWELTFTTLVVFGGAFFASFPLFYSTSFGGAYWLWMLILISFVLQAVSYEFRSKPGNLFGTRTYDIFLFVNGCVGCILLGVAVGMMFFGADFTVSKGNLLDGASPVISRWAPTHGLEAIACWKNLLLGVAVLFLARTQAAVYMLNNHPEPGVLFDANRRRVLVNGVVFVVLFLAFLGVLFTNVGMVTMVRGGLDGTPSEFSYIGCKYFYNYIDMPAALVALLVGTVMVLYGVLRSALARHFTCGIWWSGIGTVLVVLSLFWVAGYNDTPYYPSSLSPASSLTIYNSSSSEFTLTVMSYVSLVIPVVVAYIAYAWWSMDRKKK
ncbi:MAG: cytochrome d ubiquinol oxidase subunit II [Duncaniella sp.]|nr:cytochrome d ubiquinol oxidase subunit II [Duncaniella sp.]MDE6170708.1 cytochrome d ubiquinol oxidase subunit II [Duncaniella sp.]MDE6327521.1 cytochrome d ubiquinol oxidase subunit II [Duncaniella sp.]MDE6358313.1 cytochrome d ubiquinol oxidase subunit II [Duncaniella sp.]MDE6465425.1 cytochrome d ubiquinol oxidase subunit II [Duncaniella sp.]